MHDLRHTVGTWVSKTGANAFAIRDVVLRHQNVMMTGQYVNADADPVRDLHNRVGNAITALLEGRKADVISIMDRQAAIDATCRPALLPTRDRRSHAAHFYASIAVPASSVAVVRSKANCRFIRNSGLLPQAGHG